MSVESVFIEIMRQRRPDRHWVVVPREEEEPAPARPEDTEEEGDR